MSFLASSLITRVQKTLLDETEVQWTVAEILTFIKAGIKAVIAAKPDVGTVNYRQQLSPGTYQHLPSDAVYLVDIPSNYLDDETDERGDAVTLIEMKGLDSFDRQWHKASPKIQVAHYMYDKNNPRVFYVYPPQPGIPGYVEMVYVAIPEDFDESDEIPINAIYEDPLYFYSLAMAYSKNSKRSDTTKETMYLGLGQQSLGLDTQVQSQVSAGVSDGRPTQ